MLQWSIKDIAGFDSYIHWSLIFSLQSKKKKTKTPWFWFVVAVNNNNNNNNISKAPFPNGPKALFTIKLSI